jgi:hypothetical protein
MLLRNLMPSQELRNGTMLIITYLHIKTHHTGPRDGLNLGTVLILCMSLIPPDTNMLFKFKRRHFPLCFAFSMTIKKSQGKNVNKICLYLLKPVFSHGHIYVALTRVQSLGSLSVISEMNEIAVFTVKHMNNKMC